ncbi:MAG: c-type cytochrome [Pseudomonadota bacterium]|jgi:cytochrome c|nr:c-type cytochrome [Rubrivivax sp.]MCA3258412.1 c-type cytochrome [Rubrivivax sp.]MCE2911836.1 cytochrome C' [Rubrivivax sp.]MCZ8031638.1 cytochrome C' [Rubrivivax sp.]
MKTALAAVIVAGALLAAGAAQANADLANKHCSKCHEMDKKKKGPAYKATAAKYKGKADAEASLLKAVMDPNGDHPEMTTKPSADEVRTVLKWMLQQ